MSNDIVVGTSLAPFDIEKQIECLNSWVYNGIRVIVFNTAEEIDNLKGFIGDIDIKFYPIQRDAYNISGKHLPFMQDILDVTANETSQVCGYLNSDLFLYNFDEELFNFICNETAESALISHRNEIDGADDYKNLNCEINFDGIDAFFVDKHIADGLFGDESFVQTTWDGFLIAHCRRNNIRVKTLLNPIFFHCRHKVRWNYDRVEKSYTFLSEKYYEGKRTWRDFYLERYETYFDYSIDVGYSSKRESTVLIVVDPEEIDHMKEFCEDHLQGRKYSVECNSVNSDKYDVVVSVPKGMRLRDPFFEYVDFVFDKHDINELIIGAFFSSHIEGKHIYNQLNRSIQLLKELNQNENACVNIHQTRKSIACKTKTARIVYPICYREINLSDACIQKIVLRSPLYIFPAGYSAGVWYAINKEKMPVDIEGFLDSDPGKDGKEMAGKSISGFSELHQITADKTIIVCTKYYYNEIHSLLEERGISTYIDGDKILYIDNGIAYYFDLERYEESLMTK